MAALNCPRCQFKNPDDNQFCEGCGASLDKTCSSCGHNNRLISRFCGSCGIELADGQPGPSGKGGFAAESGHYHLYVSYACPWAHRTLIFRMLKGLEDHIGVNVVNPLMAGDSWTFGTDFDGATGDEALGTPLLHDIYLTANPQTTGWVTVPVLDLTAPHGRDEVS